MGKVNSPGGSCCADDCLLEEYSFTQNNNTVIAGWETITGNSQILDNALVLEPNTRIYAKDYTVQYDTVYIKFEMFTSTGSVGGIEIPEAARNPSDLNNFTGVKITFTINNDASEIKFTRYVNNVIIEEYVGLVPCDYNNVFTMRSSEWFTVEICNNAIATSGHAAYAVVFITPQGGPTKRFSWEQGLTLSNSQIGFFAAIGQIKFRNYERWKSIYVPDDGIAAGIHNPFDLTYSSCKPCLDCYFPGFNWLEPTLTEEYFETIFETRQGSYQVLTNPDTGHTYLASSYGMFLHREETAKDSGAIAGILFEKLVSPEIRPPFKVRLIFSYRESDNNYWYVEINPYELLPEYESDQNAVWKLRIAYGNTVDGVLYEVNDRYWYECKIQNPSYACDTWAYNAFYVYVRGCTVSVYFSTLLYTVPHWCFRDQAIFNTGRWGFQILEASSSVAIWTWDSGCWWGVPNCIAIEPEEPPHDDPLPPDLPPEPDPPPVECCVGFGDSFNGSTIEISFGGVSFDPNPPCEISCFLINDLYSELINRHTAHMIYKSPVEMQFYADIGATNECADCTGEPNLHVLVKFRKDLENNRCLISAEFYSYGCEMCLMIYGPVEVSFGNFCADPIQIDYTGNEPYVCCLGPPSHINVFFI